MTDSSRIVWHHGIVTAVERAAHLGQRPLTIWLTGLSGSGKSTVATSLEASLHEKGFACFVLDGDNVRHGLCSDLGFSPADRTENIRRVAEVAALMNDAGLVVITAFISPFQADRASARKIIGPERFIEVFLDAPLSVCESRDPKGFYKKARAGEIPNYTGIASPYEAPEAPDLVIRTDQVTVESAVESISRAMAAHSPILPMKDAGGVAIAD